jgi:hypothetical protein
MVRRVNFSETIPFLIGVSALSYRRGVIGRIFFSNTSCIRGYRVDYIATVRVTASDSLVLSLQTS